MVTSHHKTDSKRDAENQVVKADSETETNKTVPDHQGSSHVRKQDNRVMQTGMQACRQDRMGWDRTGQDRTRRDKDKTNYVMGTGRDKTRWNGTGQVKTTNRMGWDRVR